MVTNRCSFRNGTGDLLGKCRCRLPVEDAGAEPFVSDAAVSGGA